MSPKGTKCAPAAREAGEASGEKREKTPSNEHRLAPRNSRLLITGGAGFIGSNLVRHLLNKTDYEVLNVDKLTYAGNLQSLADVTDNPRYRFAQVDICDAAAVQQLFADSARRRRNSLLTGRDTVGQDLS